VFADAADEDEDDADDPYAGSCSNEDKGPSQRVPHGSASWFSPAADRRALNSRTRVYGYVLPTAPSHARGLHHPRPLKVRGDTEHTELFGLSTGRDSFDAGFTYNLCAWIQHIHNKLADDESDLARGVISSSRSTNIGVYTRAALH